MLPKVVPVNTTGWLTIKPVVACWTLTLWASVVTATVAPFLAVETVNWVVLIIVET